jgi:hypothetical protein
MEFCDRKTGQLRSGEEQAALLEGLADRMADLGGKKVKSVARYMKNRAPGLARYMDELNGALRELGRRRSPQLVNLCCQLWRHGKELGRCPPCKKREVVRTAGEVVKRVIELAGAAANEVLSEVLALIDRRHRASSAIENFNSLLRPYLHVHKRVSQRFLELFMAWRNLRTRPMGKHRGTSAYELLTGETVEDWLTMLGYPPSKHNH